jgi:hypothetical protein
MKEKTNTYKNWTGKDLELNKDEYIKRWMEVANDCSRLISWRDMQYTQKRVEIIQAMIKKLAGYNFDLKADDIHTHYDMDGKVDQKWMGKKRIIKDGKEVK